MRPSPLHAALKPLAKLRPAPRRNRPSSPLIAKRNPMQPRKIKQLLPLLGLPSSTQKQPAKEPNRQNALLDHHDRPSKVLVSKRRDDGAESHARR